MTVSVHPTTFGTRYLLGDLLGSGGMGEVYRAYDRLTGQYVALKRVTTPGAELRFASRTARAADFRLALAQEFKMLASLRHPYIISVLDYGFDADRQPYFTMDLLEAAQTVLEASHGASVTTVVQLLIQMLQALAYLHRRGILHRDLKPGNVLVTDRSVRVLDFGLSSSHGQSGGVSGTVAYMAPEILLGDEADERTDLFAVGIMAYEMLTGMHPFRIEVFSTLVDDILGRPLDPVPLLRRLTGFPGMYALIGIIGRLTEKSPADRYRNANEVIRDLSAALDEPVPPETAAIRESFLQAARFVGRESEMEQLSGALEKANGGHGGLWLIGGESGVGKSRLVEEIRTQALVQGFTVTRGQALSDGGALFNVWAETLRRLLLMVESNDADASVLSLVVPGIETLLGRPIPEPPPLDGASLQQRIFNVVASLLNRLQNPSQNQPVLVILEDLHWAIESIELLRYVSPLLTKLPILVVGSFRDEERPDLPNLLPEARLIRLGRLSEDSTAKLAVSMLGDVAKQPGVIDLLQRETEGNAFFLVEVVRALAEEAGTMGEIGMKSLPSHVFTGSVQRLLQRRLERVPPDTTSLLRLAAIAGRYLDLRLLEQLITITHHKTDDVTEWLTNWLTICSDAAVLDLQDGRWRFAHDKLREHLLAEIHAGTAQERIALHEQVAVAIETVYPADPTQSAVLEALWRTAERPEKERIYAAETGRLQLRIRAFRDAIGHFDRALTLYTPDDPEYGTLLGQLGECYLGISEFAKAKALFNQSLILGQRNGRPADMMNARRNLGVLTELQGSAVEALPHLEASLEMARTLNDTKQIAQLLGYIGRIISDRGEYDRARTTFTEAVALAESMGDDGLTAFVLRQFGKLHADLKEFDKALELFARALDYAIRVGDRYEMARLLNGLGVASITIRRNEQGRAYYKRSLDLFREIGDQWGVMLISNNMGFADLLAGNIDAARDNFYQTLLIAHRLHIKFIEALVGVARILVHDEQYVRALHLLALTNSHRDTFSDIRLLSEEAFEVLHRELPNDVYETEYQHGTTLQVDQVIRDLLENPAVFTKVS
jgi:eukaryotic-like serine/threonine-protein kinase